MVKFAKTRIKNFIKKNSGLMEYEEFYQEFLNRREIEEKKLPKVTLLEKHIQNLKVLSNRVELLKKLKKEAVCAEIGVNKGDFSELILKYTSPDKLHLIDLWGEEVRYHRGLKLEVENKFNEEILQKKIEINIGLSTDVLINFPDYYFDWVYLDTAHVYDITKHELSILKNKVKRDGIITGHDYIIGNWAGDCRYGVIEAVSELCVHDGWELIHLTINKDEMPSFAIQRL